jgi:UPF0755 protein
MSATPNPEQPLAERDGHETGATHPVGSGDRARQARTRRPARRWLLWLAGALLLAAALPLFALGWLLLEYPHRPGPGRGRVVQVDLVPGASLHSVARQLVQVGAIDRADFFAWHARLRGAQPRLRQGSVLLYDNMTPREVLQRLARGYGLAQLRIVVPEGVTRFDIAARLARWGVCSQQAFIAASEDAALLRELDISSESAEGLLFPDTYLLREEMDARAVVRRFVANARRRISDLFLEHQPQLERLQSELRWGPAEIVTLASIVEKEARVPHEQPMIAGVFLNRLRDPDFRPKRLQADPTVAYGCLIEQALLASCGAFDGLHVTRGMLGDRLNPYNTYRIEGLPPGPIANPGLSAMLAVLEPVEHRYFYFVAKGGGLHHFSETLQDHRTAVEQQRAK